MRSDDIKYFVDLQFPNKCTKNKNEPCVNHESIINKQIYNYHWNQFLTLRMRISYICSSQTKSQRNKNEKQCVDHLCYKDMRFIFTPFKYNLVIYYIYYIQNDKEIVIKTTRTTHSPPKFWSFNHFKLVLLKQNCLSKIKLETRFVKSSKCDIRNSRLSSRSNLTIIKCNIKFINRSVI